MSTFIFYRGLAHPVHPSRRGVLRGLREPVDVALCHVGRVPAVEDVGAHVAPVLLVHALAVGRTVAAVVELGMVIEKCGKEPFRRTYNAFLVYSFLV